MKDGNSMEEAAKKYFDENSIGFSQVPNGKYLDLDDFIIFVNNQPQSQQPEIATDIGLEKMAEEYCKKEEYGYALQPHIIPAFIEGYKIAFSKLKQRMNILKQQNDVHLLCTIESDKKIEALNQKGNESDAVELMEWLKKSPFYCDPRYWYDAENLHDKITPEAIYKLFKQSKSLPPIQSKQL